MMLLLKSIAQLKKWVNEMKQYTLISSEYSEPLDASLEAYDTTYYTLKVCRYSDGTYDILCEPKEPLTVPRLRVIDVCNPVINTSELGISVQNMKELIQIPYVVNTTLDIIEEIIDS